MRTGADSAMNTGATTVETPIDRPSRKRVTSSQTMSWAAACSTANTVKPSAIASIATRRP